MECKNYSNQFNKEQENDYTKSMDPVNVFSNRLEDMLLTSGMYSFMLRKRDPYKSKLSERDWRFESKHQILYNFQNLTCG